MTSSHPVSQPIAQPFASTVPCAAIINLPSLQAAWQDPGQRTDWLRTNFWTDLGCQLEAVGYDMMFLPDALAMARGHDGTTDAAISVGAKGSIYPDPVTIMSAVGRCDQPPAPWLYGLDIVSAAI